MALTNYLRLDIISDYLTKTLRGTMAKEAKEIKKVKRPTPQKRDLQNEKKRLRNKAYKATIRTAVREFEEALEKKDSAATKKSLNNVFSVMDKGVKKGIFKLNKASRTKARLTARAFANA